MIWLSVNLLFLMMSSFLNPEDSLLRWLNFRGLDHAYLVRVDDWWRRWQSNLPQMPVFRRIQQRLRETVSMRRPR